MKHLLHDRLVQVLIGLPLLCILAFAGYATYDRWSYVRRAYAEAARFGYTDADFLVSYDQCGNGWLFILPPNQCYLNIYFTTDLTHDQLVQRMIQLYGPEQMTLNGTFVTVDTLGGDINTFSNKTFTLNQSKGPFTNLPAPYGELWGGFTTNVNMAQIQIIRWPLNPQLTYAIDGKPFQKDVIGVGLER